MSRTHRWADRIGLAQGGIALATNYNIFLHIYVQLPRQVKNKKVSKPQTLIFLRRLMQYDRTK